MSPLSILTIFFPHKNFITFLIVNAGMDFFQPNRSELTIVFTYKMILAYLKSYCHNRESLKCEVMWADISHCFIYERNVCYHVAEASMFTQAVHIKEYKDFNK